MKITCSNDGEHAKIVMKEHEAYTSCTNICGALTVGDDPRTVFSEKVFWNYLLSLEVKLDLEMLTSYREGDVTVTVVHHGVIFVQEVDPHH